MALSARTAGSRTRLIHRLSSKMLLPVVKGEWVMSAFDVIVLVHVDSDSPQMPGQVLLRNLRSHRANNHFILFLSVPSGTESIAKRSTQTSTNMQLGLKESLPALVAKRFTAAKENGHLIFSHTHLSIINSGGIAVGCVLFQFPPR